MQTARTFLGAVFLAYLSFVSPDTSTAEENGQLLSFTQMQERGRPDFEFTIRCAAILNGISKFIKHSKTPEKQDEAGQLIAALQAYAKEQLLAQRARGAEVSITKLGFHKLVEFAMVEARILRNFGAGGHLLNGDPIFEGWSEVCTPIAAGVGQP